MAADEALATRVRARLGPKLQVTEKKMFGGLAFMVGGKMCISVGRDRLMCRIDPAIHDAALQHRGCRTVVMKGRQYRGFVHVDADAVNSDRDLAYWIALSLDYNSKSQTPLRNRPTKKTADCP